MFLKERENVYERREREREGERRERENLKCIVGIASGAVNSKLQT